MKDVADFEWSSVADSGDFSRFFAEAKDVFSNGWG